MFTAPNSNSRGNRSRALLVRATEKSTDQKAAGGGLDPYLEVAVPRDQRPVNQLAELKEDSLYAWVSLPR